MMIRLFDLIISVIGMIVLFPLLLVISVFIVLESEGGVLFQQERVGKNGIIFRIIKFRTMVPDQSDNRLLTTVNDQRITRTGKFLRAYKLDELPQLFNVIAGDMSIVGPRPEVPVYVKCYTEEQKQILTIKPGITDLASIEFSNEGEILAEAENPERYYVEKIMPRKIKLNMVYLKDRTINNYFKIIFATIKLMFR
jgi:lipopolysaccharide/colanic/teichoic acid biosynthesis glycosyltransferase